MCICDYLQNDEGAPLMCFNLTSNAWELHGLLSYHSNCGRSHHPAIFASLTYAPIHRWLTNNIGLHYTGTNSNNHRI